MLLFSFRKLLVLLADRCYGLGIWASMTPMLIHDWVFPDTDHRMNTSVPMWLGIMGFLCTIPVSIPLFTLGYMIDKVGYLKPIRKYLCG